MRHEWDRVARAGAAFEWGRRWSTLYAIGRYARVLAGLAVGALGLVAVIAVVVWLAGSGVPGMVLALGGAAVCFTAAAVRVVWLASGRGRGRGVLGGAGWLLLACAALVAVAVWLG